MNPKITLVTKPQPLDVALCFFVFDGDEAARCPLFKLLAQEEQEYLRGIATELATKEKEVKTFLTAAKRKVFIVGLGGKKDFSAQKAGLAARIAVQTAKKEKTKKFCFWAEPFKSKRETRDFYEAVAANVVMANFEFVKYKTPPEEGFNVVENVYAIAKKQYEGIKEGLRRGVIVGEEVNACRALANTPGGDMTPGVLAAHAEEAGKKYNMRVKVLAEEDMKKLGMGGVLGVSRGSGEPPRFIVMEYLRGRKSEKPIVYVGKGVTFDTGGLNLKSSDAIYEMHMDMSGGAAVIHAMCAAARLKLRKNVVGLVPAVENMPSGSSYRPGDVLRTMSGKTIEVLNTDAEGRIILADALSYAKKYNPSLVVDVATLTGAAVAALGQRYSALFASTKKLEDIFRRIGEETGDAVWPLPLAAEYEEEIKGTFGDVANIGKTRYGGAVTGAVFLWQFTKDQSAASGQAYPWVHLDIAPRMTAIEGEFLSKGAAGTPVRLLIRVIERV